MSFPFDIVEDVASMTLDIINAERFTLIPVDEPAGPNGRRVISQTRVQIEGEGVFEYTSSEYGIELGVRKSYREANDFRAVSVGRKPVLSIDRSFFPTEDSEPRQGDKIVLPDRPDGFPTFEVMDCQRDGHSRLVVRLAHHGSQK